MAEAGSEGSAKYFSYPQARGMPSGSSSRKVSGETQREAKKLQPIAEKSKSSPSREYALYSDFP